MQGSLAHKNSATLGPYRMTIPRVVGWSWGGWGVFYERGTPVCPPAEHFVEIDAFVGHHLQGYLAHKKLSLMSEVPL